MAMVIIDGMRFIKCQGHWYLREDKWCEVLSYTAPSLASLIILVRGTL